MNFGDINPAMPQPQPINECLRVQSTMDPAHSIGKPGVSPTTTNIDVRFAPFSTDEIKIKKRSMKKLSTLSRTPFTDLMLHPDIQAVKKNQLIWQNHTGFQTKDALTTHSPLLYHR